jgi:hypothetical protein
MKFLGIHPEILEAARVPEVLVSVNNHRLHILPLPYCHPQSPDHLGPGLHNGNLLNPFQVDGYTYRI